MYCPTTPRRVLSSHAAASCRLTAANSRQLMKMGRRRWSPWLLLLLLLQILLVISRTDSSSHADKTIRIGYLASYVQDGGAIDVAIEQAQNDGLLPGYNFR